MVFVISNEYIFNVKMVKAHIKNGQKRSEKRFQKRFGGLRKEYVPKYSMNRNLLIKRIKEFTGKPTWKILREINQVNRME